MPEYIDRKELINAIKRLKHLLNTGLARHNLTQKDIMRLIETQPAAEVAPVVHGRWERQEIQNALFGVTQVLVCTNCGYGHEYDEWFCRCPNCGAKMDLKEADHP